MADNKITSKPAKVNYLSAPSRNDLKFSVAWKNPPANTSSTGKARATNTGISWYMKCYPDKYCKTYKWSTGSGSTTSDTLDLEAMLSGLPGRQRDFFHPVGKAFIKYVSVNVHPYNSVGQAPAAKTTITLQKPSSPTIGSFEFDESRGELTVEIERPESTEIAEAYDVQWWAAVYDVAANGTTKSVWSDGGTSTEDSFSVGPIDITGYAALTNKSKKVVVSAKTRGWAGDSAMVTREVYVGVPPSPTITGVSVPSLYEDERVVARVKTNATTAHPVTGCRLQVLQSVDYDLAYAIMYDLNGNAGNADGTTPIPNPLPSGEEWVNVGQEDDGQVYALACNVSDVVPQVDKYSWLRVKAWNLAEVEGLTSYSEPFRLKKLETKSPNPQDDKIVLAPLKRDSTGTSAVAYLYWGLGGDGDQSDGTEVTWSKDVNAWKSTVAPDSHQTTDDDGSATYGGRTYPSHTTLYIRDLEPGETYYVRARRYADTDDGTVYGKWSTKQKIVIGNTPSGCSLSAPAYLVAGKALYATWSVDAQEETADKVTWTLYKNPLVENGKVKHGTVLKTGTGGGGTSVTWKKLAIPSAPPAEMRTFTLALACSFGGGTVISNVVTVWVVSRPSCSIVAGTVTSQPASFDVLCNDKGLDVAVTVRSLGSAGTMPDERREQEEGDCVWTDLIERPGWDNNADTATKDDYPFRVTVTLPTGVDFRDGARYRAYASACSGYVDDGPRGSTARSSIFSVAWAHQAPTPGTPTITPQDVTDEDGNRTRRCRVRLTAATGAASTDTYDVYRMTQDGPQLIATQRAAGSTVTDNYAPFGTGILAYRIATVTADGDMAWEDFEYELPGGDMRIDFDGTYVELPYNVAWSDSYAKDFETRAKLDGSLDGYWNRAITRSASLSTDLITIKDQETARRLRQLARFAGVCFVRLPNGCAFEADVQVNDMSEDRMGNYALACSLDAVEVSATGTYVNADYPQKSS